MKSCSRFSVWGLLSLLFMLLCSCEHESYEPVYPTQADRTVLFYMVADNNLSSLAHSDLEEMIDVAGKLDLTRSNVIVYMDDNGTPELYRLTKDKDRTKAFAVVDDFGFREKSSTNASVIKEVISETVKKFPAQNYAFVYWSHGDGWIPGQEITTRAVDVHTQLSSIGLDVNNETLPASKGGRTGMKELSEALGAFGKKLDYVFFDACYMLSVEVAWELREVTDYVISSPTETPGPGAPYQVVLPYMASTQGFSANDFCRSYMSYYESKYNGGYNCSDANWTGGASIGAIKTSGLEMLADYCKELSDNGKLSLSDVSGILDYDKRNASWIGYFDMQQLYKRMIISESDFHRWLSYYDAALYCYYTTDLNYSAFCGMFDMTSSNGFSCYCPISPRTNPSRNLEYKQMGWYTAAGLAGLGW